MKVIQPVTTQYHFWCWLKLGGCQTSALQIRGANTQDFPLPHTTNIKSKVKHLHASRKELSTFSACRGNFLLVSRNNICQNALF